MHSPHVSKSTSTATTTATATSTSTTKTATVSGVSQPESAAGQHQQGYFMGLSTTAHTPAELTQISSTYYQQDELRLLSDTRLLPDTNASQPDPCNALATYTTATFDDDHQGRSTSSLVLSNEPSRSQSSSQPDDDVVTIVREEQSPDHPTDKWIMNSGDKTRPFQCGHEGCGKKYARRERFQAHLVRHARDSQYRCYAGDCTGTVRYSDKRALTRHIHVHHTFEKLYQCKICKKWYRRADYLKCHRERMHSSKSVSKSSSARTTTNTTSTSTMTSGKSQPESTQIPEADQQFSGLRLLAEVSTSQINPFEALATHQPVSFDDEAVTTGIAGDPNLPSLQRLAKQSPDPTDTNKWIIVDKSQEKPYKCGYQGCDKSYLRRPHLKRHFVKHTGTSKFKCPHPECIGNEYFGDNTLLKRHIATRHTLDKPFECDRCKKRFTRKEGLKYHREHLHYPENKQKSPK